jgi:hypothetical protein
MLHGTSTVRAGPPAGWRAGEAIEQSLPAAAADRATVARRALGVAQALSIAGRVRGTARLFNRVEARAFDEVDLVDDADRLTATVKLDAATGHLRSLVHVDWRPAFDAPRVDGSSAFRHARGLARAAAVPVPAGAAEVAWDDGMTAWHVAWHRSIAGVPADGGTDIWLFPGGQVKAIAISEPPAAAPPAVTIAPEAATDAVRGYIQANGIDRFAGLALDEPEMRWLAGNDFVTTDMPDAAESTLRLAWVVAFRYEVPGWREPHEVELYVDAGSGELIGGAETA